MTVTAELMDALSSSEEKLVDEDVLESGGGGGRDVGRGTEFIVAGSGGEEGGKLVFTQVEPLKFNPDINAFSITCSRVVLPSIKSHHQFSRGCSDGILEMQGGEGRSDKRALQVGMWVVVVVVKKKAVCRGETRARRAPTPHTIQSTLYNRPRLRSLTLS